jgi:putative aldouronate transport system permease protein
MHKPIPHLASGLEKSVKDYKKHFWLLVMLLPAVTYYIIFKYVPMYGATLAFKNFNITKGIMGSPWVGLRHFRRLFSMGSFFEVLRNTILISFYKLIFGFPAPIIFAILLGELKQIRFKKTVQTISYLPHFLSWVVLASIFIQFFSPSIGPFNYVTRSLGLPQVYVLTSPKWFRAVLVITTIWKSFGWNSVIYLASLGGIDTELYEAAHIDGANRFQRILHVTIPGLSPAITIMLILAVGQMLNDDFDQIYNMYNPAVYRVADVISTYVYRVGLLEVNYSLATAVGLFKNVLAFAMILITNAITKRINDYGLW